MPSRTKATEERGGNADHERPARQRFYHWRPTSHDQHEATERRLLSFIKTPHLKQRFVAGINTLSTAPGPSHAPGARHIVMLHGFAGGIGLWMPNVDALAEAARRSPVPTSVHVIDMPGFGRSVRESKSFGGNVSAMDYMTSKLLEWLQEMNIVTEKGTLPDLVQLDLVGHSFGAYVSATFTDRFPNLVTQLVLCDPWGVNPPDPKRLETLPFKFKVMLKLFYAGNVFSVLRGLGPWGPNLLPKYRPDFAERWEPIIGDPNIFFDYVYHSNAATPPTGEQIFQACCTGLVGPQRPMEDFLPLLPGHIHVSALYGAQTWMNKAAGLAMIEKTKATRATRLTRCTYQTVPSAGHQINTDNVEGFNEALLKELNLTPA